MASFTRLMHGVGRREWRTTGHVEGEPPPGRMCIHILELYFKDLPGR